jgi:hypothetical protein
MRRYGMPEVINGNLVGQYELQRQDVPDEPSYTAVIYDVWEGEIDPEDPAAAVDRRVAYFTQENAPAVGFDLVDAIKNGEDRYGSYKGLRGSFMDHELLSVQEADREAENFREQSESVNQDPSTIEDTYYGRNVKSDAEAYERFWQNVEKLSINPEDEEANDAIRAFREQRHEAVYRKGKSGY